MTESVSMPLAPTLPFLSILREWAWVGPSRKGIHTSKNNSGLRAISSLPEERGMGG